jgi:HAD superfamily phosphoserine phosphatase-like hydrolase
VRVAVFDLDGTITRHDTLWPYLRGWERRRPRPGFWPRVAAAVSRYPFDRDRGLLKSRLIRIAMGGAAKPDIGSWTDEYVAALGSEQLCPGALAAIEHHRSAGDRLVLLSASVDLYVPAIGYRFGFDQTVCTEVAWSDGRLDGALVSENRRAEEKKRCVESLRARFAGVPFAAYGNARSDFAHLKSVEEPVLVNAGAALRREAARLGIPTAEWRT